MMDILDEYRYLLESISADVIWTEWIGAVIFILVFIRFRRLLTRWVFSILEFIAGKTKTKLDNRILNDSKEAMAYMVGLFGIYGGVSILTLTEEQDAVASHIVATLFYVGFAWFLFILVDIFAKEISKTLSGSRKKVRGEMVNFIIKFLKSVVVLALLIGMLDEWEYNVSAIIASLGLGGLAFALAAKDTIANLFGSMVILWDKPFEHGNWIDVGGTEGTVVEIGLRSTTIRTFANALVTVPNSKLANETITNWSKRNIGRQIKMQLGVRYDSNPADIQNAILEIRAYLLAHEGISKEITLEDDNPLISRNDYEGNKDTLLVHLDSLGASSINILVYCFSVTINWFEFMQLKEDLMFKFMEIIAKNNLDFAFPSQTIYLEQQELPKQ